MKKPTTCSDCVYLLEGSCSHDHAEPGLVINEKGTPPEDCPARFDILPAKRHRVKYRGETFYLVVSFLDKKPCEVFVEHPLNSEPSLFYMMAGWDSNTRFITMALKKYPLDKIIRQLDKSSRQVDDLPDIISKILKRYV